jgi:formate--tetrahydrofolate ligase
MQESNTKKIDLTPLMITGEILRMPGLAKTPAAYRIDIDDDGNISGIG